MSAHQGHGPQDHSGHSHEHGTADHSEASHHDAHSDQAQHVTQAEHSEHSQQAHGENAAHGEHKAHSEHADHGADHVGQFKRLFWIMLVLAIPVVGLNEMFADVVGYSLPDLGWTQWVSPLLGTVIYFWGGRPFLTGAVSEIRARKPGMMLLIGLAITVAFLASWGATLGLLSHALEFWWELALLIVIMLLGHWLEMRSLARTTSALDRWQPCFRTRPRRSRAMTSSRLPPRPRGRRRRDRPAGSTVPADGRIVDGSASMDRVDGHRRIRDRPP